MGQAPKVGEAEGSLPQGLHHITRKKLFSDDIRQITSIDALKDWLGRDRCPNRPAKQHSQQKFAM